MTESFIDATVDAGLVQVMLGETSIQEWWVAWAHVDDGGLSPWPCGCGWEGAVSLVPVQCPACVFEDGARALMPVEDVAVWDAFDPTVGIAP